MKCASCDRDNPAGARYCVHCGVEQSPPTPIAVAAAAMATRPRSPIPQAANAAQADVARDTAPTAASRATRHQPDAWGVDTQSPAFPAGSDPSDFPDPPPMSPTSRSPPPATPAAIPVYASHPRRLGIAALLIGACVVVALLAFVFWKVRQAETPVSAASDSESSVMSAFPPDATPQRPPRQPDAITGSPAEGSPPANGAADAGAATSPVEIKPLPVKPTRKPAIAAPVPKTVPPVAPPVVSDAAPVPERPPVAAAAKPPAVDRWAQMNDELSRCTREDFISRVICDQRVRFRYCNGYWGKTPQCPGNPTPERGQ